MSRKAIGFTLNEATYTKQIAVEQFVSNGFGKMFILPPKIETRRFCDNFRPNELGDLFMEMGLKLKRIANDITNIEIKAKFVENLSDMGKQFMVELLYDEVKR